MPQKSSHKLWNAESNNGKVMIKRTEAERDEYDPNEFSKAVVASVWGIYGASLYDEMLDLGEIREAVKSRFASVMKEIQASGEESPKVFDWEELRQAFGSDVINEIRGFVANGIKVRRTSKALDLPFVAAADLVDDLEVVGVKAMKDIINKVKNGQEKRAINQYGKLANKVASLYEEAKTMPKFAVDQAAKDYWESYYGDFGKQLVKEVKKRIKADIAYEWMIKNGVDEVAAKYWENYYSEGDYGKKMVAPKEKDIKPKDKKKEKKAFISTEISKLIEELGQYAKPGSYVSEVIKLLDNNEFPPQEIIRGAVGEVKKLQMKDNFEEDYYVEDLDEDIEDLDDDAEFPTDYLDSLEDKLEALIDVQNSPRR